MNTIIEKLPNKVRDRKREQCSVLKQQQKVMTKTKMAYESYGNVQNSKITESTLQRGNKNT